MVGYSVLYTVDNSLPSCTLLITLPSCTLLVSLLPPSVSFCTVCSPVMCTTVTILLVVDGEDTVPILLGVAQRGAQGLWFPLNVTKVDNPAPTNVRRLIFTVCEILRVYSR